MSSPVDRSLGIIYGQFIGDALGSRYEFKSGKIVTKKLEADRDESGLVPLLGGGPFGYGPGVVTDDGEMAMSLLASILHENAYDASSVACAYVRWAQTNPPDIGNTCSAALSVRTKIPRDWPSAFSPEDRKKVRETVEANVKSRGSTSLSNGSLMRQSVLTAAYSSQYFKTKRPDQGFEDEFIANLISAVESDTRLTHCNLVAMEASSVYALLLFHLLKGKTPEEAVDSAVSACSIPLIRSLLVTARDRAVPVCISDKERDSTGDDTFMGYLGVALQVSVHYLLHSSSFSDGLLRVIAIGGDTDTNGAIAGALLGARFGFEEIPSEWKKSVETAPLRLKGENGIESFEQLIGVVKKRFEEKY
ncbi:hypothetical protein PMAYCL1PPCAC_20558 [Pristionchus mayeri]|uniref:ADP-ribosylhydrolase ARH3 n=1 Tax=Pristionchus mayeri TaxID=1317129 RepID=A0AAN5CTC1_9BILA|nr:hypothetical protein PMAYCL1PPCAC_20558 [Pristionchus mayeri]